LRNWSAAAGKTEPEIAWSNPWAAPERPSEVENGEFGPNNTYGNINDLGAAKYYIGWPTYATRAAAVTAGLTTNQMYIQGTGAGGTLSVV
jgi:hypothetical protein